MVTELTKEQLGMLNGEQERLSRTPCEFKRGWVEFFGAKRMVPITRAHVALSAQDADLWFVEKLVNLGGKRKIAPTVNPQHRYQLS